MLSGVCCTQVVVERFECLEKAEKCYINVMNYYYYYYKAKDNWATFTSHLNNKSAIVYLNSLPIESITYADYDRI